VFLHFLRDLISDFVLLQQDSAADEIPAFLEAKNVEENVSIC
jgi:hypothetical protein